MKLWKYTAPLLLLLGAYTPAQATSDYQIELIIFSQITPENLNSESWANTTLRSADFPNAIAITNEENPSFQAVSSNSYTLNGELAKLKKTAPYQIILHTAWRESLDQLDKKTIFHLYGGNLYDNRGDAIDTDSAEDTAYDPSQNWQLDGTVSVKLDRYFDFDFNLLFAEPYAQLDRLSDNIKRSSKQALKYFQLSQTRRTRSTLLNYIDHPLYGVLLKVTPVN